MKALLIDPEARTVEPVEVSSLDEVKALIGYETLESDAVGDAGDRLYFDEECFLRGTPGRFQIDTVIPVSGKGVIVGAGEGDALADVTMTVAELQGRLKYL
jgi:hypothetical protein